MSELYSQIESFIQQWGYLAVFVLMFFESACIPIPSEVTMVFAGFMASRGAMDFWGVVIDGTLANVFGSIATYYLGMKGGRPFLERYGKYIFVSKHKLETADKWFARHGEWAVLISRMLPGIRTFISLPAGVAGMNFAMFLVYTFVGCLPWSFLLAFAGLKLEENWDIVLTYYHKFEYLLLAVVLLAVLGFCAWRLLVWKKNRRVARY